MKTDSEQQSPQVDKSVDAACMLSRDVHAIIDNVQLLLNETAGHSGEALDEIRSRIIHSLESARQRLHESEAQLAEASKVAIRATDEYANAHPWKVAGVALLIGFGLGWSLKR